MAIPVTTLLKARGTSAHVTPLLLIRPSGPGNLRAKRYIANYRDEVPSLGLGATRETSHHDQPLGCQILFRPTERVESGPRARHSRGISEQYLRVQSLAPLLDSDIGYQLAFHNGII
jgi:hypothetical protein